MPVDLEANRLAWFNSGLNAAKFAGEGFDLALRNQAQKSQAADRRIRERELAARIAGIELENQKLSAEIQQRAAFDAQMLNVNTAITKAKTAFDASREAGDQQPEPDWERLRVQEALQQAPNNPHTQVFVKRVQDAEELAIKRRELEMQGQRQATLDQLSSQRLSNSEARTRNEATRLQLQQMGFSLRQVDQMMKASELGYDIQGQPDVSPQGGGPVPTLVPAQRPLTTTTLSQVQQRSSEADTALASLQDAVSAIQKNPEAIGVRGIIGQTIENVKGNINPRSTDPTPITDTRQKASIAFANIAKSLRVDSGNMSRYELTKLEQAGDVLSWEKGAPGALNQLANIQNAVVAQKLRLLKLQRAKPDDTVLRSIAKSEFADLLRDNLLTLEDVARAKKAGALTEAEALNIFDSLQRP
jgi:hypothetical protein